MDEIKFIAAILCAQTILLEDVASDPIVKTVDFYERMLAELESRGHRGPTGNARAGRNTLGAIRDVYRRGSYSIVRRRS